MVNTFGCLEHLQEKLFMELDGKVDCLCSFCPSLCDCGSNFIEMLKESVPFLII